ncbi:MAG: DUF3800 domain-containing protein [Sedimentisphaerales bacterium]|nr:DUF3800 domain-containing protein [Sedimentisphaerales bacterium]
MKYFMFLDETGDHGLSYIDKNFPIFLLCGCIINEPSFSVMKQRIEKLKQDIFGSAEVVLHSRDIRKCEGAFQVLFDLALKEQFYSALNIVLSKCEYVLLGAAINKKKHIETYGKSAADPYSLSLSFVLERLVYFLDAHDSSDTVDIFVEQRGQKEDRQLLSHFNSIIDRGTYYVSSRRFKERITSFRFRPKRDNIVGLQVADLCAYPLARHLLNPKEPYVPFQIIEQKIYRKKDSGLYIGWGLKMFP